MKFIPFALVLATALLLSGCASSPFAGTWSGVRKPAPGKNKAPTGHYQGETKPSLKSSINLNSNGTYEAKMEELDYTGTWVAQGQSLTLKPETYMGMKRAEFPAPKGGDTSAKTVDSLYAPYQMDVSTDGKTLTHTDDRGVVTFHRQG